MSNVNLGAIFCEGVKYIRLVDSGRVLPFFEETAKLVSKNEAEFVEFKNGQLVKFVDAKETSAEKEAVSEKKSTKQESKPKPKVTLDFSDEPEE